MTDPLATLAATGLFTGAPQHENFCRMADLLPSRQMSASSRPFQFPEGSPITLPGTYQFAGAERSSEQFFTETDTAALLVLHDGVVRHERYALTGGVDVPWLSMSVAKSFVSALVGVAIAEGHIRGIDAPISDYIPVWPGSAYDGVSIKNVLQMSSGARWNEDYSDTSSDIFRLTAGMVGAGSLDDVVATMVGETEPGTLCRYNSGDTQALGSLLVHATQRPLADYMREKLCEPLGMTDPSAWLVDATGLEVAFAGLNMTARDYAKLGELYRNGGNWRGVQVVPRDWVEASVHAHAPHLLPGRPYVGGKRFALGYGYQWWLPDGDDGEFSAIGVYNQFVYVDPGRGVVIVKLSANRAYGTTPDEATNREVETVAFLRAIARHCR